MKKYCFLLAFLCLFFTSCFVIPDDNYTTSSYSDKYSDLTITNKSNSFLRYYIYYGSTIYKDYDTISSKILDNVASTSEHIIAPYGSVSDGDNLYISTYKYLPKNSNTVTIVFFNSSTKKYVSSGQFTLYTNKSITIDSDGSLYIN